MQPEKKRKTKINRIQADRLVDGLLKRAEEVKTFDYMAYQIDKLWLFGSYINPDIDQYSDLDVFFTLIEKESYLGKSTGAMAGTVDMRHQAAKEALKTGVPKITGALNYAIFDNEIVHRYLVRGAARISLHQFRELEALDTKRVPELLAIYDESKGGVLSPPLRVKTTDLV